MPRKRLKRFRGDNGSKGSTETLLDGAEKIATATQPQSYISTAMFL